MTHRNWFTKVADVRVHRLAVSLNCFKEKNNIILNLDLRSQTFFVASVKWFLVLYLFFVKLQIMLIFMYF